MWFGHMTVDIEIPSRLGHFPNHSFHILCDGNLTAESTRFCQTKRHVQHVFFIFRGFGQGIEHVWRQNDMTGTASTNALLKRKET